MKYLLVSLFLLGREVIFLMFVAMVMMTAAYALSYVIGQKKLTPSTPEGHVVQVPDKEDKAGKEDKVA